MTEGIKTQEEKYLKDRVDNQMVWYDKKSIKYKKIATRLTISAAVNTAFIPFVAGFSHLFIETDLQSLVLAIFGLNATITTIILEIKKFRELWVSYRQVCEKLKHEKFLYETQSGKYNDNATKFNFFVENIESILISEHSDWSKNIVNNTQEKK